MKKIFVLFLILTGITACSLHKLDTQQLTLPKHQIRKNISLNGLWKLTINKTGEKAQVLVPGCYTNQWEGKWGKPYWDIFDYPHGWENKGALYQREVTIADSMAGMNIRLHVNGCLQNYTVIWPGKTFKTVRDGYNSRNFDLGNHLSPGNFPLGVKIEDEATHLSGGESMKSLGIWDDISLQALPDVFVEEDLMIRTSFKEKTFSCEVPLRNMSNSSKTVFVKYFITDAQGKIVKTFDSGKQNLCPGGIKELHAATAWENPHLWFPFDPYLYYFNVVVYDVHGKPVDWKRERFGFREITINGPHLYINGRNLYLRGHGEHYLGDIQASREYFETWFKELKKLGINYMRLHIYPRHKILYEVADEMGFLLEAEPAFHFLIPADTAFAKEHLRDMMKSLYNHPSVIVWSVSNELRWRGGGEKPWLVAYAKSVDPTRPVFSSDFSAYSVAGDVIGHHYNMATVFKEWEQFGPNKPMIWDELGEVWQPTRPLGNGSAGYEVSAQDYATGIYRDGHDEIREAMNLIREGQTFDGELHRINAFIPWDLGNVFFRWQPYNRYKGIVPTYSTLDGPGIKAKQILPCSTPLNIWDPTLPVFEPNPGFYLFNEDIKWVRFPYDSMNFSFFEGQKVVVHSPLMIYDDLRYVDEVHCKVESTDGHVLSEIVQKENITPGSLLRNINWNFDIPVVSKATQINIVREFYYKGLPGYRDVREGTIFPKLNAQLLKTDDKVIGVLDSTGLLENVLNQATIPFKKLSGRIKNDEVSVLLVNGNKLPPNADELNAGGICIIQFCGMNDKLPEGSARLLVNGPDFTVLNSIGQKELTYWRGGNEYGGMKKPQGNVNFRMLIAGDRDSKTSALHEIYIGKGCRWVTSLKIPESISSEPAAGWLLRNLIQAALSYKPQRQINRVGLYGDEDFALWFKHAGVDFKKLNDLNVGMNASFDVLLLDARNKALQDNQAEVLNQFANNGGKVLIYKITPSTFPGIQKILGNQLELTHPYLDENTNCIKAALSWTLRSTPKKGVEYYDNIVIPQPFESNYDPFLAGLSNIDLNWNGKPMFDAGVKFKTLSEVALNDSFSILVSNWRNDWSVPPFGGEYINEGKDMRQSLWYLNRDPVIVKLKHGKGEVLICQLDLLKGEEKGQLLTRHILTNWHCSLGRLNYFPDDTSLFDFSESKNQKIRFAKVEQELANLKPVPKLPDVLFNMGNGRDGKQRKILLLFDNRMIPLAPEILNGLKDFGHISYSGINADSPEVLIRNFENAIGGSKWDMIYFSIGYDGIKDFSNSGLAKFDSDIRLIISRLKKTNAGLMWQSQPPVSESYTKGLNNAQIAQLNNRVKAIMEENAVLVNDTYGFMMQKTPEYLKQDRNELILINSDFFAKFSPKLINSIIEALKFLGN
ncbi:MAG: glycoside hydrolase family 2 TIM barrel-domain containing protein [Bacteroidota bacterium]|nr:glycoside hydrolase family 2 TIM barrel-domain containing protein [Bacteroidota bacterium]